MSDASVTSLVLADWARARSDPTLWDALEDWPMQADIAVVFDAARASGATLADAASAAFDAWYGNEARRDAYYVAACLDYLDEAERSHRLPRYEALSESFYAQLCRLPDGSRYPCAGPAE